MTHDPVTVWMILPFAALLGAIAFAPLVAHAWWERHYPKVALGLGAFALLWYLLAVRDSAAPRHTAHEYVSFICLIGALYVVSGGIHLAVKGEATPAANTLILALGGVLANVIGTTGASMVLIRPFLRANKYRLTAHHVVFFIFIVSNVGGALTPIGDPPLYLGYLKGIPFFWTLGALFGKWTFGMAWLLLLFYAMDRLNFLRAPRAIREKETAREEWRFEGARNLGWLALILAALFVPRPPLLREAIMLAAAAGSWFTTPRRIHEANHYSWAPIREVAILFAGIFATMFPALLWLEAHAGDLGLRSPTAFYWSCGLTSAVLDNAPTYLSFLSAQFGLFVTPKIVEGVRHLAAGGAFALSGPDASHAAEILRTWRGIQVWHPEALSRGEVPLGIIQVCHLLKNHPTYVAEISIAAVFFGASTYIGNGPNFMVRSIAQQWGVRMPGFLGYIFRFSLPFLLPLFLAVWWIFFRSE